MPTIKIGPTEIAQWHDLVKDAQSCYGVVLLDDLENYLVLLLQRFLTQPDIVESTLAKEYLRSQQKSGREAQHYRRCLGDKCLLFAGLYPEVAERRHVSIRYFIELGRSSYFSAAHCVQHETLMVQLFKQLSNEFVSMMDVLHCLRELSGLHQQLPMKYAIELFNDVGSKHAEQLIDQYRGKVELIDAFKLMDDSH